MVGRAAAAPSTLAVGLVASAALASARAVAAASRASGTSVCAAAFAVRIATFGVSRGQILEAEQ